MKTLSIQKRWRKGSEKSCVLERESQEGVLGGTEAEKKGKRIICGNFTSEGGKVKKVIQHYARWRSSSPLSVLGRIKNRELEKGGHGLTKTQRET